MVLKTALCQESSSLCHPVWASGRAIGIHCLTLNILFHAVYNVRHL